MSPSTNYLIDIAARLSGADATAAQLGQVSDRLVSAGASADAFRAAVDASGGALARSQAEVNALADALAAQKARHSEAETAATNASRALERATAAQAAQAVKLQAIMDDPVAVDLGAMESAAAKLRALTDRQTELQAKATETASALEAEAAALDAIQGRSDAAKAAHEELKTAHDSLSESAKEASAAEAQNAKGLQDIGSVLGQLGGPLGGLGQRVSGLAESLFGLEGPQRAAIGLAVGMTVVFVALAAAVASAVVATVAWAFKMADAARSASLTVEAVSKTSASLAGLADVIPDVQAATGMAAGELVGLAQNLDKAGVSAADMPAALRAAAMAETALGKGGSAELVEQLKAGKSSAADLAAEVESKFGGIVRRRLLSLDSQADRLKKNLSETFGGALKIEPALEALDRFGGLLDKNSAMGKTLSFAFGKIFQPMLDAAVNALPSIEAMLLGIAIGGLRAYIAAKPLIAALDALSPDSANDTRSAMQRLGETIGVAIGAAAVVVYALAWPFIKAGQAIMDVIVLSQQLGGAISAGVSAAVSWLQSVDLGQIGIDLITGLANGITSGASALISAITGAVDGAISSAKSLLGIASPSKVFAELGGYTAEGFAMGVDDGADMAQQSMEDMVAPPAIAQSAAPMKGANGGMTVSFAGANFQFYGSDGREHARQFYETFTALLEGDARAAGGASA